MREPLRSAASMTTVASAQPLITALRIGKDALVGDEPGRNCETRSPFAAISSCRLAFCGGYARSIPVPMTATVRPPAASAAVCAALSIPAARPLMTGTPLAASPVTSWRAWSMPLMCRVAGADDGNRRRVTRVGSSAHEQDRRVLVDHTEVGRVSRVENGDHPDA